MAKREYLDDSKRSLLSKKFGEQDWMNPSKPPSITTNTFGKGWRWTYDKGQGWYLKNKTDLGDKIRQNVLNPIKEVAESKVTRGIATGAATYFGGPVAGAAVNAGMKGLKDSKLADYGIQKFNESFDRDSLNPNGQDYDLRRVLFRGAESTGRNYLRNRFPAADKLIGDLPLYSEEPGQMRGQQQTGRQSGTVNSKVNYDPNNRDPFAARKYYKDAQLGGGDNRTGNPQTLFKPYGHNTGKAVVVTGSHLTPTAVSVYDAKTKKLITRAERPRNLANGNRANWDLGLPGSMIKDAVIVFEGTGRSMYVKDGNARWKSDKL